MKTGRFFVYLKRFHVPELRFAITQQLLRSLSQAATEIWTIDSGISYTGSIG